MYFNTDIMFVISHLREHLREFNEIRVVEIL